VAPAQPSRWVGSVCQVLWEGMVGRRLGPPLQPSAFAEVTVVVE
jgi:hypothetical protein